MKTVNITRGDQVAMRIELHDPELNVVVHEEIEVTEAHSSLVLDELQNRVSGEALEMANVAEAKGQLMMNGEPITPIMPLSELNKMTLHINPAQFDPKPVETRIPFDYDRWKSGDFVRVETRGRLLVTQIVSFDVVKLSSCIYGVLNDNVVGWNRNGSYYHDQKESGFDLFMVVIKGGEE